VQLEHSFTVPVPVDEAWRILLDIERIGPCLPGAVIESVDGDEFSGSVKVKLGPINLTYKGKASFVEKDESAHRAVIDARGRDARGNGTAHAVVTAALSESGGVTGVDVQTELDITGKPAQFGRGVMVDVGNKLIGQFADCLAATLGGGSGSSATEPVAAPAGTSTADTPPAKKVARPRPRRAEVQAEPAASTPAYSAPGGIPPVEPAPADAAPAEPAQVGSVNGHAGRLADEPRGEVEPIDLLQSAGPAVAKRIAPVALAVVLVLIAARRRSRRSRD
jgi:carbon monoxide dehydrogenase subunit G